jgi:enamine deaminase RidA (YjgF/YER057c/UK114 family)
MDASRAVIVQGAPLVYTRQLLPWDGAGKLVGRQAADKQVEQVLTNLERVLDAAESSPDRLVRLNVYALSHEIADLLCKQLADRLDPAIRPAITTVLTPLGHREALVAVDAIAVSAANEPTATLRRCEALAGKADVADFAILPPDGVAYFSGQPEKGSLAASAVAQSLSALLERLERLNLSLEHIVQLKVFLTPAHSAEAVQREIQRLFPNQLTPPIIFVEWIASVPVEIELVAQLPLTTESTGTVEHYNPPDAKPSPAFSRVALVRSKEQIHVSGLVARTAGNGEAQARDVFAQLQSLLEKTDSDLRHLAKATYYVSDDDGSRGIDRLRREIYDPQHPPAASKVTIHAVGRPDRSLMIDMIAVPR